MSIELAGILIAILAVGATLGGLILASSRGLRQDIRQDMVRLESRLDEKINGLEARMREDMKQFVRSPGAGGAQPSQARRIAGRIARGNHRAGRRQLTPPMQAPQYSLNSHSHSHCRCSL